MKKRMRVAGMLLAGSIAVTGSGVLHINAAQQQKNLSPTAGISGRVGEYIAQQNSKTETEPVKTENEQGVSVEKNHRSVRVRETEDTDIAIAQVDHYVNVRKEPNALSEVQGKLYNNGAATVMDMQEDDAGEQWYKIKSGNVEGYIKAEYAEVGNEALIQAVRTRYATVSTTTLYVRTEPGIESSVMTMLPEGDDVVVYDELDHGWLRVSTEEGLGYISGEYVTLRTEYKEAESKEEETERLAREEAARQAAAAAAEEARRIREAEEAARYAKEREKQAKKSTGNSGSTQSQNTSRPVNNSSNGQAVVNYASQFVGNPYIYGGTSLTNGADCSGFIMSVYRAFGMSLPHSSAALRSVGYEVSLSDIQPGDIVCYSGHVGIYAGNNTLLHASSPKTGIKYTSPITYRPILAIRRIF